MYEDLTGQVFNHLTVLEKSPKTNKRHEIFWVCQCDCENKTITHVRACDLKRGSTKSCGCLRNAIAKERIEKINKTTNPAKKPFNNYQIIDDYVEIYFDNREEVCYIDLEDLEKVSQFHWGINKQGYAVASTQAYKRQTLNNFLMGVWADHIDRNKLNNRKSNLRKCTLQQNNLNRKKSSGKTSKYKGVWFNKRTEKWVAGIKYNKKPIHLGYFTDEEEAARAYDAKALELFGEFAAINFPEEHPEANPVSTLDTQAKSN